LVGLVLRVWELVVPVRVGVVTFVSSVLADLEGDPCFALGFPLACDFLPDLLLACDCGLDLLLAGGDLRAGTLLCSTW